MKKFHSFTGGYKLPDAEINHWILQCLEKLDKGAKHFRISSGDTAVSAHAWETSIQIDVATCDGYSSISFFNDEPREFAPYQRYPI